MKINVNVHPGPEGFWFREADGTVIKVTSNWRGLVARVIAYRRRNKLPAGNPMAEVTDQACARSPGNCHEDTEVAHRAAVIVASLKSLVLQWLAGIRARKTKAPLPFVSEDLMRQRASVCASCPAHAAIAGGCGSCRKALREIRADILQGKPHADVHGCKILHEDCAINSWLDDVTVENAALPGCCWRRRSAP